MHLLTQLAQAGEALEYQKHAKEKCIYAQEMLVTVPLLFIFQWSDLVMDLHHKDNLAAELYLNYMGTSILYTACWHFCWKQIKFEYIW